MPRANVIFAARLTLREDNEVRDAPMHNDGTPSAHELSSDPGVN